MATKESEKSSEITEQRVKFLLVNDEGLAPLESRPGFFSYLKFAWQKRHFSVAHAKSNAMSTGRDSYLGKLWIILDPIFQVAVYGVIFGLVLRTSRGMDNFIGFLIIGVVFFGFFSKGISGSSGLIQSSRSLISSFHFPRVLLVVSQTVRALLNNMVPAGMAVIAAVLFQLDKPLNWTIIFVLPLFILIHLFLFGAGLIVSRGTAFIPDLKSLVSLFMRGMFFLSGVFFDISRFDANPAIKAVVEANPIYQFLSAVRSCVMTGEIPSLEIWGYLSLWTVGLLVVGLIFFWTAEERYAGVR